MCDNEVLKYQEDLAKAYKYKPLPPMFREEALQYYRDNFPSGFCLDGDAIPLFSPEGVKICDRYNRIVIGDYGAYVEIMADDIVHDNIKVKEGQRYRDFDPRYSKNVKYSWLTTKDSSDVKLYFQKKEVGYADYVPGRYYISPHECVLLRSLGKDNRYSVARPEIAGWLKKHNVFSKQLLDYYVNFGQVHGRVLRGAIDNNLFPGDADRWAKFNEVCNISGGLSYEQYTAVNYNLYWIGASDAELNRFVDYLAEDVKTAINMGLDGLEFPYEMTKQSAQVIRGILSMSTDDLLDISKFSKLVAGFKCEICPEMYIDFKDVSQHEVLPGLDETIRSAEAVASGMNQAEASVVKLLEM